MKHSFTGEIEKVLQKYFLDDSDEVFKRSELLIYINLKTKSANLGSKARGSFGNLYAIYVLVEDYLQNGFMKSGKYSDYEGAKFAALFKRQRELPFGAKLQNHALNHRMNQEFTKFFPTCEYTPIMREPETNRYWINENLLKIKMNSKHYNIAQAVIDIIDAYVSTKEGAFKKFIETCESLKTIAEKDVEKINEFITSLLAPSVDARIFEIVSFAILKYYYFDQTVFFGFTLDNIEEENLKLFKTGRTNANDGGIDFVMKPLGRFFQVTETTDVKKYFLDIDKLEKFPITFVIKSVDSPTILMKKLEENAMNQYSVTAVISKYLSCIEEIINIPLLRDRLKDAGKQGYISSILKEVITQSKVEFHYEDENDDDDDDDDGTGASL